MAESSLKEESHLNDTQRLPLIQSTTTEIYDSPRCLNKESNEKPQDLANILMKNYSR
jgi:hypothetical protein